MTDDDYPYRSPPDAKTWQPGSPFAVGPATQPVLIPPFMPSLAVIIGGVMLILATGNTLQVPIAAHIDGPGTTTFLPGLFCVLAIAGSIAAQASLLAILMVYGAGPLWRRLLWHWGLALIAVLGWCVGFTLIFAGRRGATDAQTFVAVVLGLPLIALACQAPHWLLRIYFQWRIEGPQPEAIAQPLRPLAIRDFLIGTVVVGLTMASVRLGKPAQVDDAVYWIAWSIGGAAAAVSTLLLALPALAFVLGPRDWRRSVAGVALLAVLTMIVLSALLIYLPPAGGPSNRLRIYFVVSFVCGLLGTLAGTLGLARSYGYRLMTRRTDLPSVR